MHLQTKVEKTSYEVTLTVDCAIFGFQQNELHVLLVKRNIDPFKGYWVLPGGIMNEGITLEESVSNVLYALTGIRDIHYEQVKTYSTIGRHPVKRVVTVLFYALIKPENHSITPGQYISEVKWFPFKQKPPLGYDHDMLLNEGLLKLRHDLQERFLFRELLPKKFTLKELQDLYESILDEALDRRNFRKKIMQLDILSNTGEIKQGVKGGPELYELK
ncbi:MAG: NUDIX domain-containing protein [Cyclobacteriaceae bacterium]